MIQITAMSPMFAVNHVSEFISVEVLSIMGD